MRVTSERQISERANCLSTPSQHTVWHPQRMGFLKGRRSLRDMIRVGTYTAVAVGVVLLVFAYAGFKFGLGSGADKASVVTTVLTFDAALLAVVAAVVALEAFMQASGQPDLSVTMTFQNCNPNEPVFRFRADGCDIGEENVARVVLRNDSPYSAKNPGVLITLGGFLAVTPVPGWDAIEIGGMSGVRQFQWDGVIVHGGQSRVLPEFILGGAMDPDQTEHLIVVEVVADGVKPKVERLHARGLAHADWLKHVFSVPPPEPALPSPGRATITSKKESE